MLPVVQGRHAIMEIALMQIQELYSQLHLVAQLLTAIRIQTQQDLKDGLALPTKIQIFIHSAFHMVVKSPLQVQLLG